MDGNFGNMGSFGLGMGLFGGVFMILFWGLIIVAIVVLVKWLLGRSRPGSAPDRDTALAILQNRYARGEIEADEFEQAKRRLQA
ncbi:MAG: SHOCT domain-containing protein [Gammaproteobacteria bacterium]|nr:MAG: SHOCT domain-containing protein [Gammaproteobacteria bacterium]